MIDELGEAIGKIEEALSALSFARAALERGGISEASACQLRAQAALHVLHADVMAWRCILIVAQRDRARLASLAPSLIGRAWHKLRATLS